MLVQILACKPVHTPPQSLPSDANGPTICTGSCSISLPSQRHMARRKAQDTRSHSVVLNLVSTVLQQAQRLANSLGILSNSPAIIQGQLGCSYRGMGISVIGGGLANNQPLAVRWQLFPALVLDRDATGPGSPHALDPAFRSAREGWRHDASGSQCHISFPRLSLAAFPRYSGRGSAS